MPPPPRNKLTAQLFPATTLLRSVGASTTHGGGPRDFRNELILGIICGVTSGGATMRIVAETAGAIDRLIVRVRAAAKGEVDIAFDKGEREELPELVDSLDRLLGRDRKSVV